MKIKQIKTLIAVSVLSVGAVALQAQEAQEWIPLFNGEDLSNWTIKFTGFELGEN